MRPDEPAIEDLDLVANGIRFHALASGPEDGPLVVFLHGFPSSPALVGATSCPRSAGYRAVAPDMRGYGDTDLQGPYDVGTLVRDVTGLVQALGRERTVVVGHDWGGAVAWAVAARHAELVEARRDQLPSASALAHAMRHSRAQLRKSWYILFFQLPWFPERRMAADGAAVVARALVGGSHRRDAWPPEELDAYRAAFARPGRAKAAIDWYRASFRRILRPRRSNGRSRRVAAPTLVLWGAEDRFLGRELVAPDVLRRVLTEGNVPEVVFIEDAGHFVQNEMPDRVNEELLRWLARR